MDCYVLKFFTNVRNNKRRTLINFGENLLRVLEFLNIESFSEQKKKILY